MEKTVNVGGVLKDQLLSIVFSYKVQVKDVSCEISQSGQKMDPEKIGYPFIKLGMLFIFARHCIGVLVDQYVELIE